MDQLNVNAELVRRAANRVYPQYNRDPAPALLEVEPGQSAMGLSQAVLCSNDEQLGQVGAMPQLANSERG